MSKRSDPKTEDRRPKTGVLTRCVVIAVAVCLAGQLAWGHSFPPLRTVVVQVEKCEVAVLVGYRPASGEASETLLARIASQPESLKLEAAKNILAREALAPLSFSVDKRPLVPTKVRAKIGVDPGGTKPMVVLLVTYALPSAGTLAVSSKDPRSTRISWTDRASARVDLGHAPAQGRWFTGVASFLLSLAPQGDSACAFTTSASSSH
jgi:hypothetical protein